MKRVAPDEAIDLRPPGSPLRAALKNAYYAVFPTLSIRRCSQTLYECLMYLQHAGPRSRHGAARRALADFIVGDQLPDGGFDIGYAFDYGALHRPGQGTAPETKSLVALIAEHDADPRDETRAAIDRGVAWILRHVRDYPEGRCIPYCPDASRQVLVYNGASFAQCPLAMWGARTGDAGALSDATAMNDFLLRVAAPIDGGGLTMPYNVPRAGLSAKDVEKVDYYHLAQQGEMHRLAWREAGIESARTLHEGFALHLLRIAESCEVVPYLNTDHFGDRIHVWGLASVVGYLTDVWRDTGEEAWLRQARRLGTWLTDHALAGDRFAPVLTPAGVPVVADYYPRSDAWVLEGLGKLAAATGDAAMFDVLDRVFARNLAAGFSGLENHATTVARLRLMSAAKRIVGR